MNGKGLRALWQEGTKRLIEAGFAEEEARKEALWLLARAAETGLDAIFAHGRRCPTPAQQARYRQWIARRAMREPFAYIVGEKEFFGLRLRVNPNVLVPRPETELLVEEALEAIEAKRAPRVLDLGTGSGCIAIAIAHLRPDAEVVATDISPAALAVAADNARRHRVRVTFHCGDLYDALFSGAAPFSLIVSNPPYMGLDELATAPPELGFEPKQALTDFADGRAALARVLAGAPHWLAADGVLIVEHGVRGLPPTPAGLELVKRRKDLAGLWRVAVYRRI